MEVGIINNHQEQLKQVSSYWSKLMRQNFGRGPEKCYAFMRHPYMVILMKGFISPMEEVLLDQGQEDTVSQSRGVIIESLLAELKGILQLTLDIQVEGFYHDWNFTKNTGVIVVELDADLGPELEHHSFDQREELEQEVIRVSELVQRVPDHVTSYQISPSIFLVKRTGILILIEKAFIAKGFIQSLRSTKAELEKSYFNREGRFAALFNQKQVDIYMDWNLKEDHSIVCFVF